MLLTVGRSWTSPKEHVFRDPKCSHRAEQSLSTPKTNQISRKDQYFLRQLRKFNLLKKLLKKFYSAIIESVLCTSVTIWFSSATKFDLRRLRRVVRTAERIYNPPHSPRTTHPEWAKELAKSLQTLHIQHTPSFTVWSTLQCSEHQNDQTQKQFLPSSYPSHEHLTLIMVHTLFIHLFI